MNQEKYQNLLEEFQVVKTEKGLEIFKEKLKAKIQSQNTQENESEIAFLEEKLKAIKEQVWVEAKK